MDNEDITLYRCKECKCIIGARDEIAGTEEWEDGTNREAMLCKDCAEFKAWTAFVDSGQVGYVNE